MVKWRKESEKRTAKQGKKDWENNWRRKWGYVVGKRETRKKMGKWKENKRSIYSKGKMSGNVKKRERGKRKEEIDKEKRREDKDKN